MLCKNHYFFSADFFAQKGLEGTACALNMEEVGLLLKKICPSSEV